MLVSRSLGSNLGPDCGDPVGRDRLGSHDEAKGQCNRAGQTDGASAGGATIHQRVLSAAIERLRSDPLVDDSDICVNFAEGQITLNGLVRSKREKWRAGESVFDLPGVAGVQNNLKVRDEGTDAWPIHSQ